MSKIPGQTLVKGSLRGVQYIVGRGRLQNLSNNMSDFRGPLNPQDYEEFQALHPLALGHVSQLEALGHFVTNYLPLLTDELPDFMKFTDYCRRICGIYLKL